MKNKVLYTVIFFLLVFCSCEDFLTINPDTNKGTTGNFYKDEYDIQYAVSAIYANLQERNYYRDYLVIMTDVRSDDLSSFANVGSNAGREYRIKTFAAQSDNAIFEAVWSKIYETIYRCNKVLANIDVVSNEELRNQYEGETRFLRALCYFNIVRLWGDAPLILEPLTPKEATACIRNSTADIYAAIEEDLRFAASSDNVPKSYNNANKGRVTSLAAQGMLGKVYLQQKKWNDAVRVLGTLINQENEGKHYLLPDIADVFSTAPAHGSPASDFNKYTGWSPQTMNDEMMFAVLFDKSIANEGRNALTYYTHQADINEELKASSPTTIYHRDDRRSDLMLSMKGTNTDNNLLVKYADTQSSLSQYGFDTPILRWSDVLLMYAEALNETGYDNSSSSPALIALNEVRTRSYPGGAYTISDLPNQEAFRKAVLLERRLEFPMEMQRWFDLVRTGEAIKAIARIGITISTNDLLYPIPYTEYILRDDPVNFPQNPGY